MGKEWNLSPVERRGRILLIASLCFFPLQRGGHYYQMLLGELLRVALSGNVRAALPALIR